MTKNKRFLTLSMPMIVAMCSLFAIFDTTNAATRAATRVTSASRRPAVNASVTTTDTKTETVSVVEESEPETIESKLETAIQSVLNEKPQPIINNKSNQFEDTIFEYAESLTEDNTFAEEIRRQRNALAVSEASSAVKTSQQKSLAQNTNSCDSALRKCMADTCGKDFTKCATDGDTIFGDKLNKCRKNATCTGEEFSLFGAEIKADRDTNVRLSSYNKVLNCGNGYNACIMNECGTTYNKCLGKKNADAAVQKCLAIADECRESDSGLAARFGTAIGKLRENAEIEIKKDEERLYALRDLMTKQCKSLGAAFDERSFDCVYTVEFYAGENQSAPVASRKAYAGDSFVCMQEWFGTDVTTYRENAYRETRAQTAASSAMLGSGVGMAAGALSSGAIERAIETTKAKKDLKSAEQEKKAADELKKLCNDTGGTLRSDSECFCGQNKSWDSKRGCVAKQETNATPVQQTITPNGENKGENQTEKKSKTEKTSKCKIPHSSTIDEENCTVSECEKGYTPSKDGKACEKEPCVKAENALTMTRDENGECIVLTCKSASYKVSENKKSCEPTEAKQARDAKKDKKQKEQEEIKTKTEECKNRGGKYKEKEDACYCGTGVLSAIDTCENGEIKTKPSSDLPKPGDDCTAQVPGAEKATRNKNGDCIVDKCDADHKESTNKRYCIDRTDKKQTEEPCVKADNALTMTRDKNGECIVLTCKSASYKVSEDKKSCEPTEAKKARDDKKEKEVLAKPSEFEDFESDAFDENIASPLPENISKNAKTKEEATQENETQEDTSTNEQKTKKNALKRKGMVCTNAKEHHLLATYDENQNCIVKTCVLGYKVDEVNNICVEEKVVSRNQGEKGETKTPRRASGKNNATTTTNTEDTPKPYQIPQNERPVLTGEAKPCDSLAKQAVYCFAIKNSNSGCNGSYIKLLQDDVRKTYEGQNIRPNAENATQEYWENRSKVLSKIENICNGWRISKASNQTGVPLTYNAQNVKSSNQNNNQSHYTIENGQETYEVVVIDDTQHKKTLKTKTYQSQQECETEIDAEFANGIPQKYIDKYKLFLEKAGNQIVNTPNQLTLDCQVFVHNKEPFDFICQSNAHFLKDCQNANTILKDIATQLTMLEAKKNVCDKSSINFEDEFYAFCSQF